MSDALLSSVLKNFFKIIFSLITISLLVYIIFPFIIAITIGGIIALALIPFVDYFIRKGFKRNTGVMLLTLLSGLVGLIPVLAFFIHGSRVLSKILHESQIKEFVEKLSLSSYRLIDHLSVLYGFDNEVIRTRFAALVIHTGHAFSEGFNTFVSETPTLLMMGLISILSAHCFLRESDRIRALFDRYFYFNKTNGNKFVHLLKVCCREVFFSNIITGLIQASIVSAEIGRASCRERV